MYPHLLQFSSTLPVTTHAALRQLVPASAARPPQVRNNPWAARKYREDADKLEETIAEDGDDRGVHQVSDSDAVVVIDRTGIVTVVNHAFLKLFGYRKQEEMVGKNVGALCPPPHDKLHTSCEGPPRRCRSAVRRLCLQPERRVSQYA